jgi:hypothetical protein
MFQVEIPTFSASILLQKFWSLSSIPEKTLKSQKFPNGQNNFLDNK